MTQGLRQPAKSISDNFLNLGCCLAEYDYNRKRVISQEVTEDAVEKSI